MIESLNNVIFYLGYFCLSAIFLWLGIALYFKSYEILLNRKWFFKLVWDDALNKSFKNTSNEQFEEWIERMRKKYNRAKVIK